MDHVEFATAFDMVNAERQPADTGEPEFEKPEFRNLKSSETCSDTWLLGHADAETRGRSLL